jgi:hypothetical protein
MGGPGLQAGERPPPHAANVDPGTVPVVEDPFQDDGTATSIDEHNYVAERIVEAGEVPPDSIWPRQVLRLCAELKFTPTQMQGVSQLLERMEPVDITRTVEEIDKAIRRALTDAGELPSWLRVDLDHCAIYVDDVPHTVDREVALFVKLVAAARGNAVSFNKRVAQDPRLGDLSSPDKALKKKQHRSIRQFIAGTEKGYRLTKL